MMRKTLICIFVLAAAFHVAPAHAQEADDGMQDLLRDLDALIERGEREGLADPWFLDDLRSLSARYGQTWPTVLLDHRFDSQGSSPKAPWAVRQGNMKMDWSRGLRSQVERSSDNAQKSDEELVGEIVGGLLGQALGTQSNQGSNADPSEPALALAELSVTNAFQIETTMSARPLPGAEEGGMDIGVYQGANAGYRLALEPSQGGDGRIALLAVSSRGSVRSLASANLERDLLTDEPFVVQWSRRPDGSMSVELAGEPLLAVRDNSFRDPFDGLLIGNRGGDYAVRQMTVRGTR